MILDLSMTTHFSTQTLLVLCVCVTTSAGDEVKELVFTSKLTNVSTVEYDSWNSFIVRSKIVCAQLCLLEDAYSVVYDADSRECVCVPYPVLPPLSPNATTSLRLVLSEGKC